jgi:hypothetical protein
MVTHQCEIFIVLSSLLFDWVTGCGFDVRVCFEFEFGFDLLLERLLYCLCRNVEKRKKNKKSGNWLGF